MKRILIVFLFVPMIGEAQHLTLPALLDSVEHRHPMLRMYDAEVRSMEAAAEGARALDPPQIGAGLWQAPYNSSLWQDSEMSPAQGMYMISAEQMIMNGRKRRTEYDYMRSMARVEQARRGTARADLRSEARTAYYRLNVLRRKADVLRENVELMGYMLGTMETRFTTGMDRIGGYYQTEAKLKEALAMLEMNQGQQEAAVDVLRALLVRPAGEPIQIDTTLILRSDLPNISDTSAVAPIVSDVAASNERINLMRSQQLFERSRARPDFGVRFDHMMPFGSMPDMFTVMGMVTIPIAPWSKGSYSASIRALDEAIAAERYQREALLLETLGMYNSMQSEYNAMVRQVELYRDQVIPALRKALNTTLSAFADNAATVTDVLNVWEAYQMTTITHLELMEQALMMQADLERVLEQ